MKRKVTVRISKLFIIAVAFLFLVIVIRLAYISLSKAIDGVNLHDFTENRNTTTDVVIAKRGNIYDSKFESTEFSALRHPFSGAAGLSGLGTALEWFEPEYRQCPHLAGKSRCFTVLVVGLEEMCLRS